MTVNIFVLKGALNGKIVVVRFYFCQVYLQFLIENITCNITRKEYYKKYMYQHFHSRYALMKNTDFFLPHSMKYIWYSHQKSKYPQ